MWASTNEIEAGHLDRYEFIETDFSLDLLLFLEWWQGTLPEDSFSVI